MAIKELLSKTKLKMWHVSQVIKIGKNDLLNIYLLLGPSTDHFDA